MSKVHIVNHTHWDREWYFTAMDALVLSDQLFTDAFDELAKHPEASFVLDGQLSILDEYLTLYPEKLPLIKQLVAQKQLFIGPWYTQSDANFTSGEAILRNAMIGIFESKKYGEAMRLGYLPDTFGFNAQLPVILNEAGLDNVIMWRGLDLGKHVRSPYFKWRGLGGQNTVYAVNLPQGYGTGMLLEPSVSFVSGRLDPAVEFIKKYTAGDVLIPSGNDQLAIIHDFSEKVAKLNHLGKYAYQVSTYQTFLEHIKQQPLETYQGELRAPVLARVHKTIGSVRMDIKKAVFHLEDKLTYRIEPLMVLGRKLGIQLSNRLLLLAWKKLLECQAHDSLAGCVSDTVAADIRHRLKEANELCDSIENTILKQISELVQPTANEVIVVNPSCNFFKGTKIVTLLSKKASVSFDTIQSQVIHKEYIESREDILEETPAGNRMITEPGYYLLTVAIQCELPGLGYRVFHFEETEDTAQITAITAKKIQGTSLSLDFDGESVTLNTKTGTITDFIRLIDEGNAGDTYDFSPQKNTQAVPLAITDCLCEKDEREERMILTGTIQLPYSLENRLKHEANRTFQYTLTVAISENDEITGKITFKNTILNHRVRLQINTGETILAAKAGVPYGYITRKNQSIAHWQSKYAEMPVNVEPFEKTVTLINAQKSVSIFTVDSKEYEYVADKVWLTLIATTDSLGKPDLAYRPGRASGDTTKKGHIMMATPEAQLENQEIGFDFFLRIDQPEIDETTLSWWKDGHLQPSISYQKQELNYFIHRIDNKIQSFSSNSNKEIGNRTYEGMNFKQYPQYVASMYPSYYDQQAVVIRLANPTSQTVYLPMDQLFTDYSVKPVNALEEEKEAVTAIAPYSVLSFLLKEKK